jgi:hypothetical protein
MRIYSTLHSSIVSNTICRCCCNDERSTRNDECLDRRPWKSRSECSKTWGEKFAGNLPWNQTLRECLLQLQPQGPQLNCRQVVSRRSSVADNSRGEVALPSLEEKKRKMRGPLANAEDLVQERFGELIPETISAIQRGVESLLLEANALPVTLLKVLKFGLDGQILPSACNALHVLRETGFLLNSTLIGEIYTRFQGEETSETRHTNCPEPKVAYRIVEACAS